MKAPISLWMFGIAGMIINVFAGAVSYPLFYMLTQLYFVLWVIFLFAVLLFIPFLIICCIGMLKLRRLGKNIFVAITFIMTIILIKFFSYVPLLSIALTIFLISSTIFFLQPSTRRLFDKTD